MRADQIPARNEAGDDPAGDADRSLTGPTAIPSLTEIRLDAPHLRGDRGPVGRSMHAREGAPSLGRAPVCLSRVRPTPKLDLLRMPKDLTHRLTVFLLKDTLTSPDHAVGNADAFLNVDFAAALQTRNWASISRSSILGDGWSVPWSHLQDIERPTKGDGASRSNVRLYRSSSLTDLRLHGSSNKSNKLLACATTNSR